MPGDDHRAGGTSVTQAADSARAGQPRGSLGDGVPEPNLGQVNTPARTDPSAEALRAALASQLQEQGAIRSERVADAFRTVPRHVFVIEETAVPRTATGKIEKPALRREAERRVQE